MNRKVLAQFDLTYIFQIYFLYNSFLVYHILTLRVHHRDPSAGQITNPLLPEARWPRVEQVQERPIDRFLFVEALAAQEGLERPEDVVVGRREVGPVRRVTHRRPVRLQLQLAAQRIVVEVRRAAGAGPILKTRVEIWLPT